MVDISAEAVVRTTLDVSISISIIRSHTGLEFLIYHGGEEEGEDIERCSQGLQQVHLYFLGQVLPRR